MGYATEEMQREQLRAMGGDTGPTRYRNVRQTFGERADPRTGDTQVVLVESREEITDGPDLENVTEVVTFEYVTEDAS